MATMLSRVVLAIAVLAVGIGTTAEPLRAQERTRSEIHVQQVATSGYTASDLPDSKTSEDRKIASLWPQVSCESLGQTASECALSTSVPPVSPGTNLATIVQHGSGHRATIIQRGISNVAVSTQHGSGNELSATQLGNDNLIGIRLVGHDNSLNVRQNGNDNAYLLSFAGDDLDHSVTQVGSGLRLVQLGTGSLPFSVEQQGTGMTVRIEHNPLSPWPR